MRRLFDRQFARPGVALFVLAAPLAVGAQQVQKVYRVGYMSITAELKAKYRMPAMPEVSEYVAAGGLMAYRVDLAELIRRGPVYIDKILKGAKPADLPVEQPTKFDLVINLATANALGLALPQSLLLRGDRLVQ